RGDRVRDRPDGECLVVGSRHRDPVRCERRRHLPDRDRARDQSGVPRARIPRLRSRARPGSVTCRGIQPMSARPSLPATVRVLAAIAIAAVALPLVALVARAPWSDIARLGETGPRTALLVSIEVSLAAAAVALVFGVPVALVLARTTFRGRSVVRSLALLPLVLPPVVAGVGLLAAFGRRGLIGRGLAAIGIRLPFTTTGAILASSFVATPPLIR